MSTEHEKMVVSPKKAAMVSSAVAAVAVLGSLALNGGAPHRGALNPTTTTTSFDFNSHVPCAARGARGPFVDEDGVHQFQICGIPTSTTINLPDNLPTSGILNPAGIADLPTTTTTS